MLGPYGPYLIIGRKLATIGSRLGAGNRLPLLGRKNNRLGIVDTVELGCIPRLVARIHAPAFHACTGNDITSDLIRSASDDLTGL